MAPMPMHEECKDLRNLEPGTDGTDADGTDADANTTQT